MKSVQIDLTCWLRGPFTGVGISASRSFRALKALANPGLAFEAVSRTGGSRETKEFPFPVSYFNPWQRFMGSNDTIFHSFDTGLPRAKRSKKVLTVHDIWSLRENPYQDPAYQKRQSVKLGLSIAKADFIVTPTNHVRNELGKWDPKLLERTAVVPWAPLLDSDGMGNSAIVLDKVGRYIEEKRPDFLVIACLEFRKNLSMLFEALNGRKDVDLVLVGGPGFGAEKVLSDLEKLRASGTRCVHFQDLSVASLRPLYLNSIALILPSLDEGFGMPVVEALGYGKPVILSRIPPLEEVAGNAGIYFDLASGAAGLREKINTLAGHPALQAEWGRWSLARSRTFSWKDTATRLVEVYSKL